MNRGKLLNTTFPIQINESSNSQSASDRNLTQRKPQMEQSGRNFAQSNSP